MKRTMRRTMRNICAYNGAIAESDRNYIPKHAKLVEFCEDILTELCEALDITAEFIAETIDHVRKIAEKIHLRPVKLSVEVIRETSVLARPVSLPLRKKLVALVRQSGIAIADCNLMDYRPFGNDGKYWLPIAELKRLLEV